MQNVTLPPYSNTGVTLTPKNPLYRPADKGSSDFAKFPFRTENNVEVEFNTPKYDWFAGKAKAVIKYYDHKDKPVFMDFDVEDYLSQVLKLLSDKNIQFDEVHDTRILGRYVNRKALFVCQGYQHAYHIKNNGESILSISYGGQNGRASAYVSTTGSACNQVFNLIKSLPFNLYSSRVDACYDTQQDIKPLKKKLMRYSRENKLAFRIDGRGYDKEGKRTGETLYIDLTESKRIRIYEKGYERRAENPESDAPLDWIRFEIETRGDIANTDDGKMILTQATPQELLTIDKHCTALFNKYSGTRKKPSMLKFTNKKLTDDEAARLHMIEQYNKHLKKCIETPEAFLKLAADLYGTLDNEDMPQWISRMALLNGAFVNGNH